MRSALLVLFLVFAGPILAQVSDPESRVAEAERRAAEAEKRAAAAERRAADAGHASASAGAGAPGRDLQRAECQAAQRHFQLICSRRALETAWEARDCAAAAEEARAQCAGQGQP